MNTPKIRFKGFTDDWEQRKLGDSCKLNGRIGFRGYTEKDIVTKEIGGVLTFSPTNIVDNKLTMECKNTYITREKYDESPEIKIFNGDILFVKTGSTLGKSALVTGLKEDASINPQIVVMRVEKDKETFMSNVLITDGIKKQVTAVKIGGAVPTMTETELKNIKYYEPVEKEEQKRIGQYFEHLDHLITLHQRKCDETKQLKKFMLQKMFPKNGEKNPKIRFEGFTDDWEQRKVGEFLTESRESGHKGDIAHKMTVKLWGKGVYEKKETGSANTQYFTRHAGQFIYSKLDFLNCAFGVVPEELENLETTADVPAFDCDGVNPYFMFYTAIQPRFYEKNGMIADGSRKAKRIHADTFLDMPFFVPSLKEQNKIVNLLSELDNLITLHQRKCEKLKALKKFMLQNMFI